MICPVWAKGAKARSCFFFRFMCYWVGYSSHKEACHAETLDVEPLYNQLKEDKEVKMKRNSILETLVCKASNLRDDLSSLTEILERLRSIQMLDINFLIAVLACSMIFTILNQH